MRPTFLPRLVNGPLFDPVLYVRVLNGGEALMLDCGHFRGLSNREVLGIGALCISHTHMNHFMGFDRILRTILHREGPLDIYGPEGIIDRTHAKLQAYTWNLTEGYPLEIRIHEIGPQTVTVTRARADAGFALAEREELPRTGSEVGRATRYTIEAAVLDHNGIPCLAYVVREPFHVGIRKGVLQARGYLPGPWIARLKESVLAGSSSKSIPVKTAGGTREIPVRDLEGELVFRTPGQSIAYVTDMAFTEGNLERLEEAAGGVDLLFIEAFYPNELEGLARRKGHLTTGQAGTIARRLGARRVFPMHVSPRCRGSLDLFYREMGVDPKGFLLR
ncbi:MAG TPA: MBL fold metallo-hydrolase [Deltaproteobacteria bacterium]|jgi:ribonuclease Z|nr:MBL fold metallo-hydrolase [Deltaproteobacteria bacterium]HOI07468.1 MBL fold metallo-hydrolase [Deltaproteobacteria bacterium]